MDIELTIEHVLLTIIINGWPSRDACTCDRHGSFLTKITNPEDWLKSNLSIDIRLFGNDSQSILL
ncbi:hypothetical protein DERP_007683 [Dermatophagoides pteronyssinus]|uniref:Uncharacterized protein n=1 Tax=Dermatophagoides pteronyssinus TaxID=6956 RepID=A0ABQ8JKK6_DERPT|nr:hypothetical protein DERP_007683 [Dermatophagoides pteronyssinus]